MSHSFQFLTVMLACELALWMGMLNLTSQPPGVRFNPWDEEIIQDFLRPKINGSDQGTIDFIHEVPFFKEDPWELKGSTGIETTRDPEEWFFFSKLDPKYRNGNRSNRKTKTGYWKGTGGECEIKSEGRLIGKKKILVFHTGQSPSGKKRDWVVHEYHATELDGNNPPRRESIVLCHLFKKSNNGGKFGPAKRKQARALVSPASEEEADNHVTGYCTGSNHISDTGYTRKNPVAEVTAGQNTSVVCRFFYKYKKNSVFKNAGSAVSFPTTSKSRLKETKSKLALPSVQAEDSRTVDGCFVTEDSDIPVAGGDNNVNFFAAENQVTDIEVNPEMEEAPNMYLLQDPLDCNCLTRLTLLPNTPAASSFPTESELALASVSPALGKEVSNHLTRCYSNGMTSNTITAINGNRDGYSAYTAINRVEEETTGEVVDSNMLCVLPDSNMFHVPPDLNVFCVPPELLGLSPLHLQMQSVYMPYSVANDSIYLGDEVPFQYGTNVPAAFTSDLCGPPSLFR